MKTTNEFLRELACANFDVDVQTKVALYLDEKDRAARDQQEALRTSYVTLECQYARLMDQYMELKGQIVKLDANPFDYAAILGAPRERRISMSFGTQEQYEAALKFLDMADEPADQRWRERSAEESDRMLAEAWASSSEAKGADYDRALEAHARTLHPGVPIIPEAKGVMRPIERPLCQFGGSYGWCELEPGHDGPHKITRAGVLEAKGDTP